MVYTYGTSPYSLVLVHGGPGAVGSLAPIANARAPYFGVLEPWQSRLTVSELVEELHDQLISHTTFPMTILGHSWGAWLSLLFAHRYPAMVQQLILVGCAPFDDCYVPQIVQRRRERLSKKQRCRFNQVTEALDSPGLAPTVKTVLLSELQELVKQTDHYRPLASTTMVSFPKGQLYSAIWSEAVKLRNNKTFYRILSQLSCPVSLIHGKYDPHPIDGVTTPLDSCGVKYRLFLLDQCGHFPFLEQYAVSSFYGIVKQLVKMY